MADDICSICRDSLQKSGSSRIETPCHHFFHVGCLITALRTCAKTCPLCRGDISDIADAISPPRRSSFPSSRPPPLLIIPSDVEPELISFPDINDDLGVEITPLTENIESLNYLISVKVNRPTVSKFHPTDIVIVIDTSSSMEGRPIEYVKKTLDFVIRQLDPSMRLGLITFNHVVNVIFPLTPMTDENKYLCYSVVDQIIVGGTTNIRLGEETGIRMLKERHFVRPNATILLLSDGEDSCGNIFSESEHLSKDLPGCVTINTLGYGQNSSSSLDMIARRDRGCFANVVDQQFISESFATILGGFLTVDLYDIEVEFKSDVGFGKFYSNFPTTNAKVLIPTLFGEETREILFDLVPFVERPLNLEIYVRYRVLGKEDVAALLVRNFFANWGPVGVPNIKVDTSRNRFICANAIKDSSETTRLTAIQIIKEAIAKIETSISAGEDICQCLIRDLRQILEERSQRTGRDFISQHLMTASVHREGRSFVPHDRTPYHITSSQLSMLHMTPSFR